ncbi:hypothetical protein [Mesorhizobium australicum]|uniref:hypothetical protein n=1 Tax=Mesorhizobium australicum TaxID=536018 RepID=UPI00111C3904|nr:hypothetical protein [Mesorhizobium australicum]
MFAPDGISYCQPVSAASGFALRKPATFGYRNRWPKSAPVACILKEHVVVNNGEFLSEVARTIRWIETLPSQDQTYSLAYKLVAERPGAFAEAVLQGLSERRRRNLRLAVTLAGVPRLRLTVASAGSR